jgi:hypothetical protein
MPRHDVLHDCKTETGSALCPAGLDIYPIETLGKTRKVFRRDPRPEIPDGDHSLTGFGGRRLADRDLHALA